ncbi:MULE domain-containing protein, partial [Aphis craccivora]
TYVNETYKRTITQSNGLSLWRSSPIFPPYLWNAHNATKKTTGRTNNISEGFNNKFKTLVRTQHSNIWMFIEALQKCLRDVNVDDDDVRRVRVNASFGASVVVLRRRGTDSPSSRPVLPQSLTDLLPPTLNDDDQRSRQSYDDTVIAVRMVASHRPNAVDVYLSGRCQLCDPVTGDVTF